MKHSLRVTLYLLGLFVCSQLIGVAVLTSYIDVEASQASGKMVFSAMDIAGVEIEPPPIEENTSFVYIFLAILFGTAIVLLLMRYKMVRLWKLWYFLALLITSSIALAGLFSFILLPSWIAFVCALLLSGVRVLRPHVIAQNLSELFIYAG